MSETTERLETVHRYFGVQAPTDGSLDRIARIAALTFSTSMATVTIVDESRVCLVATRGLDGVTHVDHRTLDDPSVRGELGLRFHAAAPIRTSDGHARGAINVLDRRRRRRVSPHQTQLLSDLAATVAQMMEDRLSVLDVLDAERAHHTEESDQRDVADAVRERMAEAVRATGGTPTPARCQLGGSIPCHRPAQLKLADSWGDSAWGCWEHAENALINVGPAFLATESPDGLAAYRAAGRH